MSPEFNAVYRATTNWLPALSYTSGRIYTLPKPLTDDPDAEL